MARTTMALSLLLLALFAVPSQGQGGSDDPVDDHDATAESEAQFLAFFQELNGNETNATAQEAFAGGSTEVRYYSRKADCESNKATTYSFRTKGAWSMRADNKCEELQASLPQSLKCHDDGGNVGITTFFGSDCSVPNFKFSAKSEEWARFRSGHCCSCEIGGVSAGYLKKSVDVVAMKDGGIRTAVSAAAGVSVVAMALASVIALDA